jgi:hypothetical protein
MGRVFGHCQRFAIQTQDQETVSARIHIFQGEVGQLLLGTDSHPDDNEFKLLVTGTPDTRLLKCDRARLQAMSADLEHQGIVAGMLDTWAAGLAEVIPTEIVPKNCSLLRHDESVELAPAGIAASKQGTLWVRPLEGNAAYMGLHEFQWDNPEHFMPVMDNSWLVSTDKARLYALSTAAYLEQDPTWSGLDDFQHLALKATVLSQKRSEAAEHSRLTAKAEANTRLMQSTLEQLAAPLLSKKATELTQILGKECDRWSAPASWSPANWDHDSGLSRHRETSSPIALIIWPIFSHPYPTGRLARGKVAQQQWPPLGFSKRQGEWSRSPVSNNAYELVDLVEQSPGDHGGC